LSDSRTQPDSDRLRALRVDPLDDGFQASLHRRLAAAGPPDAPGLWWRLREALAGRHLLWPAAGAAAFAALLLLALATRPGLLSPPADARVPATRVAMVRINLSADVAVASADIRVSLPPGLVFWANGQALPDRSFAWSQPLQAGGNDIPIAVRGERPGRYRMTVVARIGAAQLEHEVTLEVVDG